MFLENHPNYEKEYIETIKDTKLIEAIDPGVLESSFLYQLYTADLVSLVDFIPYPDVFGPGFLDSNLYSPATG